MLHVVVEETSVMNIKILLLSILFAVSATVSVSKTLPSDFNSTTNQPANSTQTVSLTIFDLIKFYFGRNGHTNQKK